MKGLRLMINDLVRTNLGKLIKVECITSKRNRKVGYHSEPNEHRMWYVRQTQIEPIPLTDKILESNGFSTDIDTQYYFNGKDEPILGFSFDDGYHLVMSHKNTRVAVGPIWFVHEVQQALRLCGLTELADKFKVLVEDVIPIRPLDPPTGKVNYIIR